MRCVGLELRINLGKRALFFLQTMDTMNVFRAGSGKSRRHNNLSVIYVGDVYLRPPTIAIRVAVRCGGVKFRPRRSMRDIRYKDRPEVAVRGADT